MGGKGEKIAWVKKKKTTGERNKARGSLGRGKSGDSILAKQRDIGTLIIFLFYIIFTIALS